MAQKKLDMCRKELADTRQKMKELEALFKQRTNELNNSNRELARTHRVSDIGTLASSIAHEIRNPLSAIRLAAYNIRRKAGNPAIARHLDTIDIKVCESDQIIMNLLAYSKMQVLASEPINIFNIMSECLNDMRVKFRNQNIRFDEQWLMDKALLIDANPTQILMLFTNLLDNACQATAGREAVVGVHAESLDGGRIGITVCDNGIGMDSEALGRIFEPFYTTKIKGIGLGLSLCRRIVELHNGTINLSSEKNVGTTVLVTLPCSQTRT